MRKVKLLALLLAALMVVAAFAGCANTTEIESDVANLDDRVTALEDKVDSAVNGIDDVKDALAADKTAEELEKLQQANNALLEAIEQLKKDLAAAEDKIEDAGANVTDTAALQKLADEYGAKIGRLQAEVMAEQMHYLADDYVAILEALTAAQTEIAAAGSVEAMTTVFNNLTKKLAGFTRVDETFYNFYVALKGNYTGDEACLAKVAEALDWYDDVAVEHYEGVANWTKYENGEVDKKGNPVVVDLADLYAEIAGWEDELVALEAAAEAIVKRIEDIAPDASYAELAVIAKDYFAWKKTAEALSPVHVALVDNYDDLVAAQAASLNYTVAYTIAEGLSVAPAMGESENQPLFTYYNLLKGFGTHVVFVAVDDNGVALVDEDGDVVYTADLYAAIDAAIENWVTENDITADVAEYIINDIFGNDDQNFYATYKNVAAFVDDMVAEYNAFKAGTAASIKALNSKKLSASQELFTAYKANAAAINDWYDAAVKAYDAACTAADKADKKAKDTRAVSADNYAAVLEANFNEMVVLAGLGAYNTTEKEYYFGDTTNYALGIVADDVADTDDKYANLNYIQFYNFADAEAAEFLQTTFVEAEAIAKVINDKVAKFPVLQQITVAEYLTTVGGYHTLKTIDGVNTLVAEDNVAGAVDTVAEFMAVYGKGGSAYAANSKADLSGLIDMAAYNATLTAVFARVEAIDDATAALSTAYKALLGSSDEAIITTANTASVATLVNAITEWKKAGGRSDAVVPVKVNTVGGVDEYELINVIDAYEVLAENPNFEAIVKKLETRSIAIVREAKLLLSLYQMLDKVNAFSAITYDSLSNTTNSTLTGSNLAATGVQQRDKDSDGKWDWNATYITYSASSDKFVETTAYKIYGAQDTQVKSEALKKAATLVKGKLYTGSTDVNDTLDNLENKWKDKAFTVTQLIEITTKLYDKFMVDNYGVKYADVETAKESFIAANGGYEFKGWLVSVCTALDQQGYDAKALKTVTTLDGLTQALNAAEKTADASITIFDADIVFGGYNYVDMTADFAISDEAIAELGIVATDYNRAATIVWECPDLV